MIFVMALSHDQGKGGVVRTRIRTSCWFRIISSITLVVVILSSPTRTPQPPNQRIYLNFLYRDLAIVPKDSGLAFMSATPQRASVDTDNPIFEEEVEDESFWSFSQLVC